MKVKRAPDISRREALVEAAYREIAARGFEGLRTREVAASVGVNIATLHYYFPAKEDVIRAVVGHALSRFQSTLSSEGSARERLQAHFDGLRRLSTKEPELFSVMAELMLRSARDRSLAQTIRKTNEYWEATLATMLRAVREEGDLPPTVDPRGMAAVVVATLKGTYLLPASSAPADALDRTLSQLEALLATPPARARARAPATRRGR